MPRAKKDRGSSTPGKSKGFNCQRSQMKTQYAKDAKWYKKDVDNYMNACLIINAQKGNLKSGWIEEAKNQ
jgi:hypothetical protein